MRICARVQEEIDQCECNVVMAHLARITVALQELLLKDTSVQNLLLYSLLLSICVAMVVKYECENV
jgi:hypothetical protein